jgi:hypothetical protein
MSASPLPPTDYNLAHDHIKQAPDAMVRHVSGQIGTPQEARAVQIARNRLNTILDVFFTDAVDAMKREKSHGQGH